ncbi:hypothetical protein [Pseudovibrio sp. Tun.PSC04-5.I4]|uniref:hypothetical protein n=1 Tax=Pseudovibrio sp. Tun.PSC04-5.I4 TaxID=1798213 RepID=UPI000885393F|nr:hypothetical protein [Pseudovibrio sp. Tun.PSC04-5.I4]SDR32398.1 hypothetical protein SAMN04515695_4495 [Pseudovibrio sp. Tun.PSC04-5.I4]
MSTGQTVNVLLRCSLLNAIFAVLAAVATPSQSAPSDLGFSQILQEEGIVPKGRNYEVVPPVLRNGTLLVYKLKTNKGTYTIPGTGVLRKRINELAALKALSEMDSISQAGEGIVTAVATPLTFLGNLVTSPKETLSSTADGVGLLINGTVNSLTGKSGATARGKQTGSAPSTVETVAAAVVGRDKARRHIAVSVNVDPYTTFPPLSEALDRAAWAYATSNRLTNLAGVFIPGGVGTAVSGVLATTNFSVMLKENPTVADERMREALGGMGISQRKTQDFLRATSLTRGEKIIFVASLSKMQSVRGLNALVAQVSRAGLSQDAGYYYLLGLMMINDYHLNTERLASIELVEGVPVATTRTSRKVAFIAGDRIGWSVDQSTTTLNIASRVSGNIAGNGASELRVLGLVHPTLKAELGAFNWVIREKAPLATLKEIDVTG